MPVENAVTPWRIAIGTAISVIFTLMVSVISWLLLSVHEIDRTQEVVLQRLITLESQVLTFPQTIDVGDRWRKTEEEQYQEQQKAKDDEQDRRLKLLEDTHIYEHITDPRHNGRYTR